jgi:uncharacterized protein
MGFLRFLLLILIIWILWHLFQRKKPQLPLQTPNHPSTSQHPPITDGTMVRCDYCGLHLPENEARRYGEVWYCCETHQHVAQKP